MIERRPWMLDEHLYPFVTGWADGRPVIAKTLRRDFNKNGVRSKFASLLKYEGYKEWRCFISGVQCYWLPSPLEGKNPRRTAPWAASIEHLVPKEYNAGSAGPELIGRSHNLCLVGLGLNVKLGHIPLPLKLLHRQMLSKMDYDREDFSAENFQTIRANLIIIEDAMKVAGRLPWQPWAYPDGPAKEIAIEFMAKMAAIETEFLSKTTQDEARRFMIAFDAISFFDEIKAWLLEKTR